MSQKKKSGCGKKLLMFLGIFGALVLAWCFANIGSAPVEGQPLFEPSLEANVIVSPLDKMETSTYIAALNEIAAEGVTPDQNAVVKFVQAIGPKPNFMSIPRVFFDALGIERPSKYGNYFLGLNDWFLFRNDKDEIEQAPSEDDIKKLGFAEVLRQVTARGMADSWKKALKVEFVQSNSWTKEELPEVAQWLKEQESSVQQFAEGFRRESNGYDQRKLGCHFFRKIALDTPPPRMVR
jgi:hypothetical protein